jgi:iron(III) transport system ATP-binding protein
MADRIVVMNHGVVEQIGTPADIYTEPASLFVARFVGHMNLLAAVADPRPGWARAGGLVLRHRPAAIAPGAPLTLGIRPEEVRVEGGARTGENRLTARVTGVQFQGAFTRLALAAVGDGGLTLECDVAAGALADLGVKEGAEVPVLLAPAALRAFAGPDAAGG